MKFWKSKKHDCKDHCGHVKIVEDTFLGEFIREVLKVKKYQLLAKKYNLEFEFGEDI